MPETPRRQDATLRGVLGTGPTRAFGQQAHRLPVAPGQSPSLPARRRGHGRRPWAAAHGHWTLPLATASGTLPLSASGAEALALARWPMRHSGTKGCQYHVAVGTRGWLRPCLPDGPA